MPTPKWVASRLIPHVPFITFDPVPTKQLPELVLKRLAAMMLLLRLENGKRFFVEKTVWMMTLDNDWGITNLSDTTPSVLEMVIIADTQGCKQPWASRRNAFRLREEASAGQVGVGSC